MLLPIRISILALGELEWKTWASSYHFLWLSGWGMYMPVKFWEFVIGNFYRQRPRNEKSHWTDLKLLLKIFCWILIAIRIQSKLLCFVYEAFHGLVQLALTLHHASPSWLGVSHLGLYGFLRGQVLSWLRAFAHASPSPWVIPVRPHMLCLILSFILQVPT